MPAGQISAKLNLNGAGWSAAVNKAIQQTKQLQTATGQMGAHTVSQMQAASAAIRTIEGGMANNVRAVERFITTIPGIGKALQAAFPLVGAAATVGILVRIGDEAVKAAQKVQQAQQSIDNGFRTLNQSGQTTNDTLATTNDRLENEIAKLQGRPQNNLKLAIDEARLAASKLAESLDQDNAKIKQLLSQNAVPWWAGFLGKAGTSNVSDTVNAQNQHLSDLAAQANVAQHSGDAAEAARLRIAIDAQRSKYLQDNAADIAARLANQKLPGALNQGANISALQGQNSSLFNQFDQESELARNQADEQVKAKLEAAKALTEAQKQAQEKIVAAWRQAFDEAKADNDMTLAQDAQFWVQRMEEAKKGSLSYLAALDEVNKAIARMRADNMKAQAEFASISAKAYLPNDQSGGDTSTMKDQGRDTVNWLKTMNQGIELRQADADAMKEASMQMELMTGRIGKLDAAQMLATLHEEQYARAVKAVNDALANAQNLPDGLDKKQTIADLNNQMEQIQTTHTIQSAQDQQKVSSQQIGPAVRDALGNMVQDWTNMSQQIVQIMTRGIDSLNDDIVKAMTGQGKKGDFGKTLMDAGQGLLKASLQNMEGDALKALHIGGKAQKPDGTQNNRIYTSTVLESGGSSGSGGGSPYFRPFMGGKQGQGQDDDQQGGQSNGGGSIFSQLFHKLFGGQSNQSGGGGSDSGGGDDDDDSFFQGAFAGGGDFMANRPMLVGEMGPEILTPRHSGRIIPNHEAFGGGGGNTSHFHIDARGSNDPAAIHAAVMRAAPHIVATSVRATHQVHLRSSGGRR